MAKRDQYNILVIRVLFGLGLLVLLLKIVDLQLIDSTYSQQAKSNVLKSITQYPIRGLVYDRNNELLAYNEAVYDLQVTPRKLEYIDTSLFLELTKLTKNEFIERISKARAYSFYKPSTIVKQIPVQEFSFIREDIHHFPAFSEEIRTIRNYPHRAAAHLLGDIGEIDTAELKALLGYAKGDYVGKSGIEKTYEQQLGGKKGNRLVFVDVHNRVKGAYENGQFDSLAVPGKDLQTTIDINLQQYAEKLLVNKVGAIVAIEPSSGEILALASSPTYDPNLLRGRDRGENFAILSQDTLGPFNNRALMGRYPPGSTFKPFVALAALQLKTSTVGFDYRCYGYYTIPGYYLKCSHSHPSVGNVMQGIQYSCNPYFWQMFRNSLDLQSTATFSEAYENWHELMRSMGFDSLTHIDLEGEYKGWVPEPSYYNELYGARAWKSSTILSLGIGQGELLITPLQLANAYALIANRGHFFEPHVVKSLGNEILTYPKRKSMIDSVHFIPVIEGLDLVVDAGTARRLKIPDIRFCGKTGTAQNPHGEDHSVFAGFGPKDNPKIAIAVVVENGGGGSKIAAPIASLMTEFYVNDSINPRRFALEKQLLDLNLTNQAQALANE